MGGIVAVRVKAIDNSVLIAIRDVDNVYNLTPSQLEYIKSDPRDSNGRGILHLTQRFGIQPRKIPALVELGLDPLARTRRRSCLPVDLAILHDPECRGTGLVTELLGQMKMRPNYSPEARAVDLDRTYFLASRMNNEGVKAVVAAARAELPSKKDYAAEPVPSNRVTRPFTDSYRKSTQLRLNIRSAPLRKKALVF